MTEQLKPTGADVRDGAIFLEMQDASGSEYEMKLSVFDVSTLVSMLYQARGEALQQPSTSDPEIVLSIADIRLGEDDQFQVLRLYVSPTLYQDFAARKGSPIASVLDKLATLLATESGETPTSFQGSTERH